MVEKPDDVEMRSTEPALSPQMQGDGQRLAAIREGIERTEAEMARTMDAIQQKMNFDHLREQAQEKILDALEGKATEMAKIAGRMSGELGQSIVETVKENPLPVTLLGIGLGWLMLDIFGSSSKEEKRPVGSYYNIEEEEGIPEELYQAGLEEPGMEAYREKSGFYGYQASVQSAAQKVRGMAGIAQNRAGQIANETMERAKSLGGKLMEFVEDNAVVLSIGAVGLGIAAGLMLPKTGREEKLLGEARETIVDKTIEFGQRTLEKAGAVAEKATQAARQEAERQNLISQKGQTSAEEPEGSTKEAS